MMMVMKADSFHSQISFVTLLMSICNVQEQTSAGPPPAYKEGPHKLISDSLYSLIIFIYVSITFLYMFYAFCWRSPDPKPLTEGEKNLPMITEEITAPGDDDDDH